MTHRFREILLVGPDLLYLAICLLGDPDVPLRIKLRLGAAVAYFISPIDLLPEALLGPIGYADDIAILAWVLNGMLNQINPDVILRHWAGESSLLVTIQKAIASADKLLGSGLIRRLKKTIQ